MGDKALIQSTVDQLRSVLEEQVKVYRLLLELVRREKDILISAHLDDLNENNRGKESMLIKIRSLEVQRLKHALELHRALDLEGDEPRLLDIARNLDDQNSERLRSVHNVLELLLRRVQEYNRQNEALVNSALTNITDSMNQLKTTLQDKPTYQKKGEVGGVTNAGQLVSREA